MLKLVGPILTFIGAHWKQVDSFRDYPMPPGKTKTKPSLRAHSFFDAGKALKKTQDGADLNPDADPILN
jgi:hypothetical protein